MRRDIIKGFLLWFCVCLIPAVGFMVYVLDLPLDLKILQMMILASLICLSFLYISFMLNEFDLVYAGIFACIFSFGTILYGKFNKGIDARLEFLYILMALLLIAIILRFVVKKYSKPNDS